MSSLFHGGSGLAHPGEEQLLRYADGELAPRQARKVEAHLKACWQCRTELEEIGNTVSECVRYRKQVLAEHLPEPPARWADLSAGFDEIDRAYSRASRMAVMRRVKTWLPVAAALVLGFGIYYQLHRAPAVEAAELLRKAVAAADAAPAAAHRVRIRTRRQTVIQEVGSKLGADAAAAQLLTAAHFNADDPLSARSFAAWRDGLAEKRDTVTTAADRYEIRTSTPSGELAEATLRLRSSDLHPVQERLEFRNQDWMEIEELVEERILPPASVASNSTASPAPAAVPHETTRIEEIRKPAPAATVGDELQVLVALHKLGADLGDPIEVKRADGQVLVAGVGIEAQRRQQIEQALGARQNVVVRFSDPGEAAAQPEKPVRSENGAGADAAAMQARIEKQLGGRANYEQLAGDVLDASESMMSRAYALRRLAESFPRDVEAEMTPADRQVLQDLYREHAEALAQQTAGLNRLLRPVLAPLGGRAEAASGIAPAVWQADTENLFRTARHVESLLAVMLGVTPGETANLPSQVLSSLAKLRANAEAYGPGRAP